MKFFDVSNKVNGFVHCFSDFTSRTWSHIQVYLLKDCGTLICSIKDLDAQPVRSWLSCDA